MEYVINFDWNSERNVWIATSEDIVGLVLASESYDALIKRVRFAVTELLNSDNTKPSSISLVFQSKRCEKIIL